MQSQYNAGVQPPAPSAANSTIFGHHPSQSINTAGFINSGAANSTANNSTALLSPAAEQQGSANYAAIGSHGTFNQMQLHHHFQQLRQQQQQQLHSTSHLQQQQQQHQQSAATVGSMPTATQANFNFQFNHTMDSHSHSQQSIVNQAAGDSTNINNNKLPMLQTSSDHSTQHELQLMKDLSSAAEHISSNANMQRINHNQADQQDGIAGAGNNNQQDDIEVYNHTSVAQQLIQSAAAAAAATGSPDMEYEGTEQNLNAQESAGNRWPRQETLALLRIRQEMDSIFRDSSVKRPLWEEVSRKLAELGYNRSAKKCKEKFENVHKYYKRTKEGKAGRQDGKHYRFFSELEALHSRTSAAADPNFRATPSSGVLNRSVVMAGSATAPAGAQDYRSSTIAAVGQLDSGSDTSATSSSSAGPSDDETDYNNTQTINIAAGNTRTADPASAANPVNITGKKRKRKQSSSSSSSTTERMMAFFDKLLSRVMTRQEQMQQKLLDTLERRETDRMFREETWKRQEMARMSKENELRAQERNLAATRDEAIVAFLQKVTGQTLQLPATMPTHPQSIPATMSMSSVPITAAQFPISITSMAATTAPIAAQPIQSHHPAFNNIISNNMTTSIDHQHTAATATNVSMSNVGNANMDEQDPFGDPNSKRWPKPEVLALIDIRTRLHPRFIEVGPKGPLWEEISQAMGKLGYSRNAKRCKEKWENINKYFKKAKESNKNRPENAKTCPYYHQLDALYKQGVLGAGSSVAASNAAVKQAPPSLEQQAGAEAAAVAVAAPSVDQQSDKPNFSIASPNQAHDQAGVDSTEQDCRPAITDDASASTSGADQDTAPNADE